MSRYKGIKLLLFSLIIGTSLAIERNIQEELLELGDYDRHSLPHTVANTTTEVYIKFRINDVNLREREEILELDMWITMTWEDPRLKWEPENEKGGESDALRIRRDRLWVPDLTLYNNVYDNQNEDHSSDLLIVYPSGLVLYVFPTKLEVACVLDMTYWPYDTQICKTKFGSWVYDGYKMNLNLRDQSYSSNMDEVEVEREFTDGRDNNKSRTQWEVVSAGLERDEKFYACCSEPYPHVELTVELKRVAPAFYSMVQKPAFALSLLMTVVFLMPPGAVEKLVVASLNAMLNIQFLAYISEKVEHPLHHTPLILSFMTDQVIFSVVIVFLTALVVRIAKDPHHQILPEGFQQYLSYAAFGCCVGNYRKCESGKSGENELELEDPLSGRPRRSGEGSPYAGSCSYLMLAAVIDRILFFIYFVQVIVNAAKFYSILF